MAAENFSITIGNQILSGWQEVRVTRGVERFPMDFELAITDRYPEGLGFPIKVGSPCVLETNDDLMLTGYVDTYFPAVSASKNDIRISGQSMCEDIHDCHAVFVNGDQKLNQKQFLGVDKLAEELCEPFGIQVKVPDGTGGLSSIPIYTIQLGETIYQVIEPQARVSGLLIYDDTDGSLVLAKPGTNTHTGKLTQSKPIQLASASFDMRQRMTEYDVFLQSADTFLDTSPNGNKIAQAFDTGFPARADGKPRYRPFFILAENTFILPQLAQNRANFIRNRQLGRSQAVRLTVSTWRDAAGLLWTPNYLVQIDLPYVKISNQTWLLSEVTFMLNQQQGTIAELTLMPPAAFSVDTTPLFVPDADTASAASQGDTPNTPQYGAS